MDTKPSCVTPRDYEIRIADHLSDSWAERFKGLAMRCEESGETVISGQLDQAGLQGVLSQIVRLNLTLISVTQTANKQDLP